MSEVRLPTPQATPAAPGSGWTIYPGSDGKLRAIDDSGDVHLLAVVDGNIVITEDYSLTVPATGTAALRESANTFTAIQTLADGAVSASFTATFNTEVTLTPGANYGLIFFYSSTNATAAILYFRVTSSGNSQVILTQGGTSYTTTIGTASKINVRANNDGTLTFENRLSSTVTMYRYFLMPLA